MAFTIKQNDYGRTIRMQLYYVADANGYVQPAPDLTTATGVTFHAKSVQSGAVKIDRACTVISATTAEGALGPEVEYAPAETDLDTAGQYEFEVQVMYSGNRPITFPDDGNETLTIVAEIS